MNKIRLTALALATALLVPVVSLATGVFSDVPDTYPYKGQIEALARDGIISGNPDGTFAPDRTVNRAELLKLLYVATGKTPKPINVGCFTDVETGSWYESYVCDAAAPENRFVQGYSDGKFRPGSPVTRTEALKMIFTVFGLPAGDVSSLDRDLIKFVDISVAAWYTKYVSAAYRLQILPIAGQDGVRFYPDKELLRGETAAYIFNAQRANERKVTQPSSSESSVSSVSVSSSASSSVSDNGLRNVMFPFSETDRFTAKKPISYLFSLTAPRTVVTITAAVTGFYPSDISCRLYLVQGEGFSDEYYLGVPGLNTCVVTASVPAGSYQLQLQPAVGNVPFSVSAAATVGDGNDGFIEAVTLKKGRALTDMLVARDLYDWFKFTAGQSQPESVSLTSGDKLTCIIYTPSTVDQYGFSGPECNKPYQFQPGTTYVIGVGRSGGDLATKAPYTLVLQ